MILHYKRQWHLTEAEKYQLKLYERQEKLHVFLLENVPTHVPSPPTVEKPKRPCNDMYEPIYKTKSEDDHE